MKLLLYTIKISLKAIYVVFKLFPVNTNKILFLSRQSDYVGLDFKMLQVELKARTLNLQIVTICKKMDGSIADYSSFGWSTLKSMYHMATCEVCILDSYWPAISILTHKKCLTVIQIWHALGKIKQSGYQTLTKSGGRDREIARIMRMHKNYDVIIAGGERWNRFYCQSFGVDESVLRNIGLPRIDHLLKTERTQGETIHKTYPEFKEKQVILYAPTFRRNNVDGCEELIKNVDYDQFILIVKGHPNQKLFYQNSGVYLCPDFTAVELLSVCDYLITDYSAIALEGAVLNKKTYYYLFDYEDYIRDNGLNIDLYKEMPGCVFNHADELIEVLENVPYNAEALTTYRQKYLPERAGTSTDAIVDIILENYYEEYNMEEACGNLLD